MQHSRLRVRKQLSKIEKKMATLSSRLDASPEQQATQQTTNTDLSTSGSVTCLELCTAAREDLRRFAVSLHGSLYTLFISLRVCLILSMFTWGFHCFDAPLLQAVATRKFLAARW